MHKYQVSIHLYNYIAMELCMYLLLFNQAIAFKYLRKILIILTFKILYLSRTVSIKIKRLKHYKLFGT